MQAATRRRARALEILSRLREQDINSVSRDLKTLQDEVSALEAQRQTLDLELSRNLDTDTLEGSFYLARYARSMRDRIAAIGKRIAVLKPRQKELEEKVLTLFTEKKTYEIIEQRIRIRAARMRERRDDERIEENLIGRFQASRSRR